MLPLTHVKNTVQLSKPIYFGEESTKLQDFCADIMCYMEIMKYQQPKPVIALYAAQFHLHILHYGFMFSLQPAFI